MTHKQRSPPVKRPFRMPRNEKILAQAFNNAYREPARRYEKTYKLSGIAGKYRFPKSLPARKIQDDGHWKKDYATLTGTWKKLVDRNPCLKQIKTQEGNRRELVDALMGVVSGFNVNDINFFLDLSRKNLPAGSYSEQLPAFKEIYDWIRQKTGQNDIYWVPSLPTLQKMKSQLESKNY